MSKDWKAVRKEPCGYRGKSLGKGAASVKTLVGARRRVQEEPGAAVAGESQGVGGR